MRYSIADIIVDINVRFPRLKKQAEKYIYNGDLPTDVEINIEEAFYEHMLEKNPQYDYDILEYLCTGSEFYSSLIQLGGMMLHSSCVVRNNKAYLFSAPCGTGKSTHTNLWLKRFPDAYILNDDKPAIRITKNGIYAYGTPFSGKHDISVNKGVLVGGICVLKRDTANHIEKMEVCEALHAILDQTQRPVKEDDMDKLLQILDVILCHVPVYKLYCNMDIEAAEVAYNGMKEQKEN